MELHILFRDVVDVFHEDTDAMARVVKSPTRPVKEFRDSPRSPNYTEQVSVSGTEAHSLNSDDRSPSLFVDPRRTF
jgi:hypothetical protein